MSHVPLHLTPDNPLYPRSISPYLGHNAPACLAVWGVSPLEITLSNQRWALLCSAQAPAGILLAVHDLAQRWRQGSQVLISGFHSPVEQEALEILLRGPGRIIYCPARSLPKRLEPTWRIALEAGRLTILSPFPNTVRRATKETAIFRNRFIAAWADMVLIAYAHPGSSTEQIAREALGWGKAVYTLPHTGNAALRALGALSFEG